MRPFLTALFSMQFRFYFVGRRSKGKVFKLSKTTNQTVASSEDKSIKFVLKMALEKAKKVSQRLQSAI